MNVNELEGMTKMKYALTIAGFDGSAGAGVLADIKTMHHFGVYGEAVCTALTEQNEDEFLSPGWVSWSHIESQLEVLFKKRSFKFVKIGLVKKAKTLRRIVYFIRAKSPDAFIVWDPIASATAGFNFLRSVEQADFMEVMKMVDLVTPNQDEFKFLGIDRAVASGALELGKDFALLLKGGHSVGCDAVDVLWNRDGQQYKFTSPRIEGEGKHGTGCNLSSAILANLALGKTLPEACEIAKKYMSEFIQSGEGRLGFI